MTALFALAERCGLVERPTDGLVIRWTRSTALFWSFVAVGFLALGYGLANVVRGSTSVSNIASVVLLLALGLLLLVGSFGYVDLYADRLVLNSPLRFRTDIPLADVEDVSLTTRQLAIGTTTRNRWRRHTTYGPYGVGVTIIGGERDEIVARILGARDASR